MIESLSSFDRYRLVVAPMLFMLKPGVGERLVAFVKGGGTLVLTYLSGIVNETNIVFRGGWPGGGLREAAGIWAEEIDSLLPTTRPAHRGRGRATPSGSPASTRCASTASGCTRRAPRSSPPSRTTSTRGCRR